MDVDWRELHRGLARTRPFVLSHHVPAQYDRCYAPTVCGRTVRLCARCTGIYPGILAGLWAYFAGPPESNGVVLVAVLPMAALLDWTASAVTAYDGSNPGRTATGILLGYAYGLGLAHLFVGSVAVAAIGAAYGVVAALLLSSVDAQPG